MSEGYAKKHDSHSKSLTEALTNTFGGYPIAYLIGIAALPAASGWIQEDPLVANAAITLVFSTASFLRIYFLRRVFDKFGCDGNIIRLIISLYKKRKARSKK